MRKEQRFLTNAIVSLADETGGGDGVKLRNLSEHGGAIWSKAHIGIEPNSINVITITPEEEICIGKIQLEVKFVWMKMCRGWMEAGFSVIACFSENEFMNYLEYLTKKQLRFFVMGEDLIPIRCGLVHPLSRTAQ